MSNWLYALVLKPLILLAFFGLVLALAYLLRPLIPDGRVKTLLYDRTFRERHAEWFNGLAIFFIVCLVFFSIYLSN